MKAVKESKKDSCPKEEVELTPMNNVISIFRRRSLDEKRKEVAGMRNHLELFKGRYGWGNPFGGSFVPRMHGGR